jgi:hypothetical protein
MLPERLTPEEEYDAQFKGDNKVYHLKDRYIMNNTKLDYIAEYGTDDYYYSTTFAVQTPMPPQMVDMEPPPGVEKGIMPPGILVWKKVKEIKIKAESPVEAFKKYTEIAKGEFVAFAGMTKDKTLIMPGGGMMPTQEQQFNYRMPGIDPNDNHRKKRRH